MQKPIKPQQIADAKVAHKTKGLQHLNKVDDFRVVAESYISSFGNLIMDAFHYVALFTIAFLIILSAGGAVHQMLNNGHISIDDILLLFIYLELAAMVGIYFKTNHMPVRFLIYIAMTALTRLLIADIQHDHKPNQGVLLVAGATVLFAIASLILSFSSYRYPTSQAEETKIE